MEARKGIVIEHLYQQPPRKVRIKLEKGKGGQVSWEIDAEGETVDEVLGKSREANTKMRNEYGI